MASQSANENTIFDRMMAAVLMFGEISNMLALMMACVLIYVVSWPFTKGPLFLLGMRKIQWEPLFLITGPVLLVTGITFLAAHKIHVKADQFDKDRASAVSQADEFRKLYNAQNYVALYELEAPAVKSAMTREQFIESMQASADELGKYKSSVLIASSCFPNEVRLVYHSEYEKGNVTEWMVWSNPQDMTALAFYRITPGYDEIKMKSQANCPV